MAPSQTDLNTAAFTLRQPDTFNKVLVTLFEKKQDPNIRVTSDQPQNTKMLAT